MVLHRESRAPPAPLTDKWGHTASLRDTQGPSDTQDHPKVTQYLSAVKCLLPPIYSVSCPTPVSTRFSLKR